VTNALRAEVELADSLADDAGSRVELVIAREMERGVQRNGPALALHSAGVRGYVLETHICVHGVALRCVRRSDDGGERCFSM